MIKNKNNFLAFKASSETSQNLITNSISCNDLLKQQARINERLASLEKRIDLLLVNNNDKSVEIDLEKFEKLSNSFKKVEKKQNVIQSRFIIMFIISF